MEAELLPASMVRKFVYCPRLFYLELLHGEWSHTEDTVEGTLVHQRVDVESGQLPSPESVGLEDAYKARSVTLSAPTLGVVARMDLVEGEGGVVRPVDYKKGAPGPDGPRDPEVLQLVTQGLVLRENGYRCDEGILYYAATRKRCRIVFDANLESRVRSTIQQMRKVAKEPVPPPPLIDSPKCPRCSLVGVCLPDEVSLLRGESLSSIRRLLPARDDAAAVYVQEQGARVRKSGGRLLVESSNGASISLRLLDVSQLSLFGNVQITAQALRALSEAGIPIFHYTYGGWLVAITTGLANRNVQLRVRQYEIASDEIGALKLAQKFVIGKLKNQRTLLRRNHRTNVEAALHELRRLARLTASAKSRAHLLGLEGLAARIYFAHFGQLLSDPMGFDKEGRTRRPPTDPVNALLSFLYSLLVKDVTYALMAVGLDPYQGFYHSLRYGRPSLALDLAEEFRPLIADSTVLRIVNGKIVDENDFVTRGRACALKQGARRRVIKAYESRMQALVTHPLFGYRVSYRRVMEVQARLLARAIEGDIPEYRPFTTR